MLIRGSVVGAMERRYLIDGSPLFAGFAGGVLKRELFSHGGRTTR